MKPRLIPQLIERAKSAMFVTGYMSLMNLLLFYAVLTADYSNQTIFKFTIAFPLAMAFINLFCWFRVFELYRYEKAYREGRLKYCQVESGVCLLCREEYKNCGHFENKLYEVSTRQRQNFNNEL